MRPPSGTRARSALSGPAVMIGYLDDPEATAQALRLHGDGRTWLHTGDLGKMDADGFFYFTGRLKRMIKSSGFNVYPAQVEAALYQHPFVAEACVVGVPDASQVERVKAYVVLRDPGEGDARDRGRPDRALPRATHQVVVPARSRVPHRSAQNTHRKNRLSRAGDRTYGKASLDQGARMTEPTSKPHGGDRTAAVLHAHGVRTIFTLCGGHISPILVAAKARGLRIVDTRDEATAVFAADATARLTGTTGVAAVTAGPGLTNTITALKNAQLAQSPVLLSAGRRPPHSRVEARFRTSTSVRSSHRT